jgi:hypothetical protein
MGGQWGRFFQEQQVNSTPPLSMHNLYACLQVDTLIGPAFGKIKSAKVIQTKLSPPIPCRCSHLLAWEHQLPNRYIVAASPRLMSLAINVEIESTDTAVKRHIQAFIDCGVNGCFINIEWAKSNNIPTCPLTNPIPVYIQCWWYHKWSWYDHQNHQHGPTLRQPFGMHPTCCDSPG